MSNIPSGVIFVWTGTNAGIPSGWVRETALDGKFPKGDTSSPNSTGGAATHSHSAVAHTHTLNSSHTHDISSGANSVNGASGTGGGSTVFQYASHTHATVATSSVTGGGLSSVNAIYDAVSNDPPYREVIFIKPSGSASGIPPSAVGFYDNVDWTDNTTAKGWYFSDGNNSTVDLKNKYLKGASTGADGGTTGGSTTNIHTLTHQSNHTVASHTHGWTWTASSTGGVASGGSSTASVGSGHTHAGTTGAATDTIDNTSPQLTTTETVEPAYKKLIPIANKNGSSSAFIGLIGMWLGSIASIPANYLLCNGSNGTIDMNGKHLKLTNATSEVGNTGGSNTHTHASQDHTHTSTGTHTHVTSDVTHSSAGQPSVGSSSNYSRSTGVHTVGVTSTTASYSNAATTGDSQSNEPSYRTVAFIKLKALEQLGGSFIYNLL